LDPKPSLSDRGADPKMAMGMPDGRIEAHVPRDAPHED
jgi:hypothetical protein